MTKGANVVLGSLSDEDVESVVVSLGWVSPTGEGDADVSVLLLDENGKVRGDTDFYFYNNPCAPDGSVQLLGKTPVGEGSEDRIGFDLKALPDDVATILVAASRYESARFDELEDLRLTLSDGSGEPLLTYEVGDAGGVSALIFGELYRRGEEWKFRAVGQGYESGFAALASDHGVDIEDDAETVGDAGMDDAGLDDAGVETEAVGEAAIEEPPSAGPVTEQIPEPRSTPEPVAPVTGAVPSPRTPDTDAVPAPRKTRPRTAKKKVTLPKALKKSLAENDAWHGARLFPVSALKSDRDREMRATSVLLAVMAQVPEFGRRLTAGFGAPAGRMETFTEVSLPHGDTPRRPDGVIRVERAGKLWTALVETKTNGNPLKAEQVQAYADIAARRGYEAVITLSNDVALEGSPLVEVKIDRRRKNKVSLWHLSWAEVAHQAQMLIRHEGVVNPAHAWLLEELLHYLLHENSGCHGFQNMGPAWVPVRSGIQDETLCQGDPRALETVESWERLVRQVSLGLGGELGLKVLPVQRARRDTDAVARRSRMADQLCQDGKLQAELRIEGVAGVLGVTADLRTTKIRTSIDIPAPEQGYPLSWAKRIVRELAEAPADLHIETLVEGETGGPRGTLERLRPEPGDMLPKTGVKITGFRLSLFKSMGAQRGNTEAGFIRSIDEAVHKFNAGVLAHLDRLVGKKGA
ncbi:TerD family protein [Streptomyces sp. LaPpAH-108]|uniref:TerD family protein n=1 Tax=Streptomyces sp. LaPpAH-108 TaxID=1155714 RepID=UPI0005644732|nr:TerD family protein [Streptomyces sp. LaPpAH-108]